MHWAWKTKEKKKETVKYHENIEADAVSDSSEVFSDACSKFIIV
jgi:hypothetical protein